MSSSTEPEHNSTKQDSKGFFRNYLNKYPLATVKPLGIAISLAVLILLGFTYRHWPSPLNWLEGGRNGQIIVNSPTVYTRQRLVNDRLSQTSWLQEQLKVADGHDDASNFRIVEQVRHQLEERNLRAAVSSSNQPNTNSEPKQPDRSDPAKQTLGGAPDRAPSTNNTSITPTTAELFRAKNNFRNLVRTEMMQTQLDDRHDIRGNTVYRFSFDASILAGSRTDALAAIEVRLSHSPRNDKETALYREDYIQVYSDWVRYMQSFLANSSSSISQLLLAGTSEPRLRLLYSQFLISRICEFMNDITTLEEQTHTRCDSTRLLHETDEAAIEAGSQRIAAENLIKRFVAHLTNRFDASARDDLFESIRRQIKNFPMDRLDAIYFVARDLCRDPSHSRDGLSLWQLNFMPSTYGYNPQTSQPISCPRPFDRHAAAVLLYDQILDLHSRSGNAGVRNALASPDAATELASAVLKRHCGDSPICTFLPNLESERIRCFAVDFLRANLNAFDRPLAEKWERIRHFMKLELVGRELKDCHLSVSALHFNTGVLDELQYHLDKATEVFSYGVSPKNLSQHISTASDVRDAFQMLARLTTSSQSQSYDGFAETMRKRSEQIEGILAHPIIVGFGSARQSLENISNKFGNSSSVVRQTAFGWAISPQFRTDRAPQQSDGQYDLAAVISIPSWWRSVSLEIETCWVSRYELISSTHASDKIDLCKNRTRRTDTAIVRLPGMIQELSRKLGFETIQEPYLNGDQGLQILETGKPGSLLLSGGRLWRSTEVTLGAQRADTIIVLPNMEGIIARFKCVEPQWNSPAANPPLTFPVTVRVWTSEGVAQTASVFLRRQDPLVPCREENTLPGQRTSSISTNETPSSPAPRPQPQPSPNPP